MHVRRSLAVIAATALGCSLAFLTPAQAGEQETERGRFNIQQAVNRADPGDTIRIPSGTYRQTVTIRKDGIKLVGRKVVIKPPANARPTPCDRLFGGPSSPASGICILGDVDVNSPTPVATDRVRNVSIKGITVVDAPVHGLIGIGTRNLKVTHSTFKSNGGYGAASFVTVRTTFAHNKAVGNVEAGFYVGDSPNAKAKVYGNYSRGNLFGYFFRNASHGTAKHNVAKGNCLGMLVLADAPGPATDWTITRNKVIRNNKLCIDPEAGNEAISGAGIVMAGARDFTVSRNRVAFHRSTASAAQPSLVEGGILVVRLFGPTAPSGDVVKNRLYKNRPDVVWDRTGQVRFKANKCGTSRPRFICD
jgi:Right handed beta helix region